MNIIDIIILIAFAASAFLGFNDGVIRQAGSLIGIILAIVLANRLGALVASLLHIGGSHATLWGFLIVLVACLVAVGFLTSTLQKIVSAVGLGIIDRILGAALGVIKCGIIISLLLFVVNLFNSHVPIIDQKVFNSSALYPYTRNTWNYITPAIDWIGEQLPL